MVAIGKWAGVWALCVLRGMEGLLYEVSGRMGSLAWKMWLSEQGSSPRRDWRLHTNNGRILDFSASGTTSSECKVGRPGKASYKHRRETYYDQVGFIAGRQNWFNI